jgi:hypothetical protein
MTAGTLMLSVHYVMTQKTEKEASNRNLINHRPVAGGSRGPVL